MSNVISLAAVRKMKKQPLDLEKEVVKLVEEIERLDAELKKMQLLNKTLILILQHNSLEIPAELKSKKLFRRFFTS